MILLRSICVGWATKTGFIASVILILITFHYFGQLLQDIIEGNLSIDILPELVVASVLLNLRLIFPFSCFLALLLELAYLYNTNGLMVLFSSGMGKPRLALILSVPSLVIVLLTALLSLYFAPLAKKAEKQIWAVQKDKKSLGFVRSGKFTAIDRNKAFIYVQDNDKTAEQLHKVFLFYDNRNAALGMNDHFAMVSNTADQWKRDKNIAYVNFSDGQHLAFDEHKGVLSRTAFKLYGLKLDILPFMPIYRDKPSTASTMDLWKSDDYRDKTELAWRLSLIILVAMLMVFALAGINLKPRKSAWSFIVSGLVFFFCYMLGINLIQSYMWKGAWPVEIGMWPVHFLAMLCILVLSMRSGLRS